MKYAIFIINKFNGDSSWLGMKHETRAAAVAYAEKEICSRCNRIEFYPVDDDAKWVSRKDGFTDRSKARY